MEGQEIEKSEKKSFFLRPQDKWGLMETGSGSSSPKLRGTLHNTPVQYTVIFMAVKMTNEPRLEKTNVLVSNLVRLKPGCTATEDGYRVEIWDLER